MRAPTLLKAAMAAMVACAIGIGIAPAPAPAETTGGLQSAPVSATQVAAQSAPATASQVKTQSRSQAYKAYAKKLLSYQKRFGKTSVKSGPYDASYLSGIAFAKLVDFGYKVKGLVVCYYDPSKDERASEPGAMLKCYPVEVWQWKGGALKRVYRGTSQLDGQNVYCSALPLNTVAGRCYIPQRSGSWYPNSTGHLSFYGKKSDGSFGRAIKLTCANKYANGRYTYKYYKDGKKISASKYNTLRDKWTKSSKTYYLNTLQLAGRDLNSTASIAKKTLKALQRYVS